MRRLLACFILGAALLAAFPAPAIASASSTVGALQMEPAVEAELTEEAEEDQPWTARYLAPLFVVMAVGAIVVAVVVYLAGVKRRFTVVE